MKLQIDKRMHLVAGLVMFVVFLVVGMNNDQAALAVCLVAIGKEVWDADRTDRHTPDVWDTLATIVPAMFGWVLLEVRQLL